MNSWNNKSKYCSRECSKKNTCFNKGHEPWSKINLKGISVSPDTQFKKGQTSNEANVNWKGDDVGLVALHNWVARKYGKPQNCEDCGDTNKSVYHWANISGEYKRDRSDWKRLCALCHKKLDSHLLARGEKHGMSKLNKEKVKLARMMYKDFSWDTTKIHRVLGSIWDVSMYTIQDVISRKTWKHI